jgi:hypothetical protein
MGLVTKHSSKYVPVVQKLSSLLALVDLGDDNGDDDDNDDDDN